MLFCAYASQTLFNYLQSSIEKHRSLFVAVLPQPLLPGERVSNDGGEVIALWIPPEQRAGAVGSRDDLCWIARSARCNLDLEVDTGDALDHLNHLAHRETM